MADKIRVMVFTSGQPPVETEIDNTFEAKQALVGGRIEYVCLGNVSERLNEIGIYINEDGKDEKLPPTRTLGYKEKAGAHRTLTPYWEVPCTLSLNDDRSPHKPYTAEGMK